MNTLTEKFEEERYKFEKGIISQRTFMQRIIQAVKDRDAYVIGDHMKTYPGEDIPEWGKNALAQNELIERQYERAEESL